MSLFSLNDSIVQIILKVSSDKGTIRLDGFDESIEEYRDQLDADRVYMTNVAIKAFAIDENEEKVMDVGFLSGVYFEAEELFGEGLSLPMLCDMVSSDACEMAEAITDGYGKIKPILCRPGHNLLYVKKLYVEEACRGFGVGRYLLNNLSEIMLHSLNMRFHACTLMPYPQIKTELGHIERATEDVDKKLSGLIRFYEKAGFETIDGSKCMYRKYTDVLDELFASLEE